MALRAPGITPMSLPSSLSFFSSDRPCTVRLPPLKSSFVGLEVGEPRVSQLRLTCNDRLKCNGLGGGTYGSGMNIFERLARIFRSYVNAILANFEDPVKIIDQAIIDMKGDLLNLRKATAEVLAAQRQLESKCKAAREASEKLYERAQLALQKGDDDLAHDALARRKSSAIPIPSNAYQEKPESDPIFTVYCERGDALSKDNARILRRQLDQQKSFVDKLVSNTRLLESKIVEAKSKKDLIRARSAAAKTAMKVQEMIGTVGTSSALSAFERMEEKVMTMEAQAESINQLTTDELEGKFKILDGTAVEDDFAELKRVQSASTKSKLKGELPTVITVVPSNIPFPFPESEMERELNELRR